MGEIGSLKNRWKQWWQNRKRQKKLEEQEVEEKEKKKQYNRFQVVTRTLFGLFLGLLETTIFSSKKKESKMTIKEVKVEIQKIERRTTVVKEEQDNVIKQISKVKTQEEFIKVQEEHRALRTEIVTLKERHKRVEKQATRLEKKKTDEFGPRIEKHKKEQVAILPILKKQEIVLDELEQTQEVIEEKLVQQEEVLKANPISQDFSVKKELQAKKKVVGIDTEREELFHYIKENNQLVKEIDGLMKRLSEPIGDDEIGMTLFAVSNLYDKLFPSYLSESSIRHRIRFSKYLNDSELKKIDKVGFLKSDGIYKERLDRCEQKKRELQNRQQQQEQIKETQKKEKRKLEQKKEKVNQLEQEKKQLKNTLLEQRIMIASLEQSLDKLSGSKKKQGILSRMGRLVKNTLFAGLGITTILKSKRSMLGVLTGVLLTNHGIRGMRNMNRSNENKLPYFDMEKILEQIKSEKDALVMSLDFCSDSLEQINDLQLEVATLYPYTDDIEVVKLKEQLYQLEEQLVSSQQKLLEHQQQMEIAYEKGVQKIKKLEEKS